MADFYLKSGVATERANSTAYVVGDKVVIARADTTANYLVIRKWVLECTTAGTSGAAVPAWPATVTQDTSTLVDGTVTWTFRKPGFSSGATPNWLFSAIYLDYVTSAAAAGDTIYVSNNHAESTAASFTVASVGTPASPIKIVCVSDLSAPPTAAATTGVVTCSAGYLTLTGSAYLYGLTLNSFNTLAFGSNINDCVTAENCSLRATRTDNAATTVQLGTVGNNTTGLIHVKNSTLYAGTTTGGIIVGTGNVALENVVFGNGSTTIIKGIGAGVRGGGMVACRGSDFSGVAATASGVTASLVYGGTLTLVNCKLPATWSGVLVTGALAGTGFRASMYNCDSADTNYRLWIETYAGSIKHETTIVRTGGASDGTTTLAWKMASSANANYLSAPLVSDEIVRWNDTVAAAVTATVEIIHDSQGAGAGAAFTNEEVWLEVMYLGTSGVPLGSFISNAKADVLATAADQATSTATWTTTGLTTPVKQKLSITFTPQEKGFMLAKVHLGKASKTLYVDPKILA